MLLLFCKLFVKSTPITHTKKTIPCIFVHLSNIGIRHNTLTVCHAYAFTSELQLQIFIYNNVS